MKTIISKKFQEKNLIKNFKNNNFNKLIATKKISRKQVKKKFQEKIPKYPSATNYNFLPFTVSLSAFE